MKSLILMLQFFTRIPISYQVDVSKVPFTKGIKYFAFVGLVVGSLDAIAFYSSSLVLPYSLAAAFAVLCNVLITGGLHYDGLADTCDGIFSARSREKMLEIMKDSRIGTNGAIGLCFDIGLKILLLSQIAEELGAIGTAFLIVSMTVIAKMMLSLVIILSRNNSKESGLGRLFIGATRIAPIAISFGAASVIVYLMIGNVTFILIPVNVLFLIGYKKYIVSKLGVMTGDTMGAFNEISELIVLLICLIVERNLAL